MASQVFEDDCLDLHLLEEDHCDLTTEAAASASAASDDVQVLETAQDQEVEVVKVVESPHQVHGIQTGEGPNLKPQSPSGLDGELGGNVPCTNAGQQGKSIIGNINDIHDADVDDDDFEDACRGNGYAEKNDVISKEKNLNYANEANLLTDISKKDFDNSLASKEKDSKLVLGGKYQQNWDNER